LNSYHYKQKLSKQFGHLRSLQKLTPIRKNFSGPNKQKKRHYLNKSPNCGRYKQKSLIPPNAVKLKEVQKVVFGPT
jgi:hypothetical protein